MSIKLGRVLKVISTILIAVGIAYLFLFVTEQNRSVTDILDQPSYYVMQNYKMLFLAGIAAVAFSVLGSFFSWSEKIDPKEQVLMNAGYTSAENIETWLKGSTAEEESRELRGTTTTVPENTAGRWQQGTAAPGTGTGTEQLGYAMPQAGPGQFGYAMQQEPMTEEARRELERTFSKPFESPSTVVVDFKPSEVIKKVDEIAEAEPEPEAVPEPEAETVAEPEAEEVPVPEPEVVPESEVASESETEAVAEPAPAPEVEPVPAQEVEAEPKAEMGPEAAAEPAPEPEMVAAPAAEPEVAPETEVVPESEVVPEPEPETAPETEVMREPEAAPAPETEAAAEPETEEEEEAAITETLEDEEDDEEAAITETLEDEEAAITETLENDSTGKEADA